MGGAEALGDGLHVGDGGGGGPQTEAAVARRQHGRVIVAAHDPEGDEDGVERHRHRLGGQQDEDGQGQAGEIPQLQAHQRHGEEERQADVAEQGDLAVAHLMPVQQGQQVAQQHADEEHADEHRQLQGTALEVEGEHLAPLQADGNEGQGLDHAEGGEGALHVRHLEALGGAVTVVLLAGHLHLLHQVAGDRTADQAPQHQTEGGAGDGELGGGLHAVLLGEDGAPGRAGAVAAGEGDGAGQQPHVRVQTQQGGQTDPQAVLHQQQAGDHQQEGDHRLAAALEAAQIGGEADGGEEGQHQRGLQCGVKLQFKLHGGAQQQQHQSDHQAACHRFGDVEGAQGANPVDQQAAKQQHQGGGDQGGVGIKLYHAVLPC
ncbi:hypothetical protein D3C85_869400 [compost metagenome]